VEDDGGLPISVFCKDLVKGRKKVFLRSFRQKIMPKGERINVCVRGPQFVWLVGFQISVDTSILIPDQEFRDFLARRRRKFWIFRVCC